MVEILKSYLNFLYNSKNHHGVHSPFVYNLVTKCFYNKKKYPEYGILNEYRKSFLQDKSEIEITDFGAGSRIFKNNTRKICDIAKTSGISKKRAQLLFRITKYFQPDTILEIGTSLGMATVAIHLANPNAKITTLEGCPNTIAVAKNLFKVSSFKLQVQNIEFINTEFSSYLKTFNFQLSTFNLIYFDGNHSKQATLEYFNLLLPTITNETVWIFDDIHWSKKMEEAWQIIKDNPQVKVTIDTFQWGIVFFRQEQEKEHFVIRV